MRADSLPPVSVDSLYRRRPSVSSSSVYSGPSRAPYQRRGASPAPPVTPVNLPTIRQGLMGSSVSGRRRASYSGTSPNYRAYISTPSASRHATPDRSTFILIMYRGGNQMSKEYNQQTAISVECALVYTRCAVKKRKS